MTEALIMMRAVITMTEAAIMMIPAGIMTTEAALIMMMEAAVIRTTVLMMMGMRLMMTVEAASMTTEAVPEGTVIPRTIQEPARAELLHVIKTMRQYSGLFDRKRV